MKEIFRTKKRKKLFREKFNIDNLRTYHEYQKVDFTNYPIIFQYKIIDKLSEKYQSLKNEKNDKKNFSSSNYKINNFPNKSLVLIQAKCDLLFEDIDLDPRMNYYRNDKKLTIGNLITKGDNWISYRSKLLGGGPEFEKVMIKFYVIYSSMNRMLSMEKVDLIDLSNDIEDWLMTDIGYHLDYRVEILEGE
jgi:hypothetical protein